MLVISRYKREGALVALFSLLFLLVGAFFVWNKVNDQPFSSEFYAQQQAFFHQQEGFAPLHLMALTIEASLANPSVEQEAQPLETLHQHIGSQLNLRYLQSSRKQIRAMAEQLQLHVQQQYPSDTFQFIDTVYARDAFLSLFLDRPLSYLFFLSNQSDEPTLILATLAPNMQGGYSLENFWFFPPESPPAAGFIPQLLHLYHQKIR
jgi:hypothetical protein